MKKKIVDTFKQLRKNSFQLILILAYLFVATCCIAGCSSSGTSPSTSTATPVQQIFIDHFSPSSMPDTSFRICFYCRNIASDSVRVETIIKIYALSGGCKVLDTTKYIRTHAAVGKLTDSITILLSNFDSCNYNNTVYDVTAKLPDYSGVQDNEEYVRGNPELTVCYPGCIEKLHMPIWGDSTAKCDSIRYSIDSTYFYHDSEMVRVQMCYSSSWTDVPEENFPDVDTVMNMLTDYVMMYKPFSTNPYTLIIADNQEFNPSQVGVSNASSSDFYKFSFLFKGTLDDVFQQLGSYYVPMTGYKFTVCHELMHQIGGAHNVDTSNYLDDHTFHVGRHDLTCVLHDLNINSQIAAILQSQSGTFRICDRHIFKLRSSVCSVRPDISSNRIVRGDDYGYAGLMLPTVYQYNSKREGFSNRKHEISMKLGKSTYKKFEPILAQFIIVNKDSLPLDISGLFDPMRSGDEGGPNILITDDKGNKWSKNKFGVVGTFVDVVPQYIVEPEDTLYVSMPLNTWAADARDLSPTGGSEYMYFGCVGYFPPGKYRASFTGEDRTDEYNPFECTSDEFVVAEDDEEDLQLLQLNRERKNEEIMANYSGNALREYQMEQVIIYKYGSYLYTKDESDPKWGNLTQEYESFVAMYPDSYYLLYDRFVTPYITKSAKGFSVYEDIRSNVENKTQNEMLRRYMLNKQRVMTKVRGYENKRNDR